MPDAANMRILLLLLVGVALSAVDVEATVISVADGDTMTVRLADGTEAKIRFLSIDTPESHANQHGADMAEGHRASEFTKAMLPAGTAVTLNGPKAVLEKDRYGRLLAYVVMSDRVTAQEKIVAAGWSVYWRKYGEAPAPLHERLVRTQEQARSATTGAWATVPQWMIDKSNERTAPKGGKSEP
jgi:2',3'-cyclic-nucleotide 2'-phosphodiesterase/3'-nucleotidase/5'-nucleotidase